jgi:hypothetical protein
MVPTLSGVNSCHCWSSPKSGCTDVGLSLGKAIVNGLNNLELAFDIQA